MVNNGSNDRIVQMKINSMLKTLKEDETIFIGILKDEEIREKISKALNLELSSSSLKEADINLDIVALIKENESYKREVLGYLIHSFNEQEKKLVSSLRILKDDILKKENENKEITQRLEETKDEFKNLMEQNQTLKEEIKDLELESKELEAKNKARREKRNELEKEKEMKDKEYIELKNEISFLTREKESLTKEINNIRPMYEELKNRAMDDFKNILNIEKENLGKEKSILENNIVELKEEKRNLESVILDVKNRAEKITEKENEIKTLSEELKFEKEELQRKKEALDFFRKKIEAYETDIIKDLKENHEIIMKEKQELINIEREKNQDLEIKNRNLEILCNNSLEKEEMKEQIDKLTKENTLLKDKLFGKTEERERKIRDLEAEKRILEEQNEEILNENSELKVQNLGLRKYQIDFETKMAKIDDFENSKEDLLRLIEKKDEQIAELKGRGMSEEAKKQVIEQSYFEKQDLIQRPDFVNEMIWLGEIMEKVKNVGFVFSSRLLYAFHTSLKISDWSSLSILAGVSGTGKSELPKLYSRYGGLNFISLAVQPNWDSPHSLFGYYNSLEGKFNATSLLKILYQAQAGVENSINDYLTIVLLDEMNLAHVELYFSELLSKLESLRGKEEGEILEIDIAENKPYEIVLNNSIMWVGTMNEDETTKSLSDKVIDRGNLISFPKPNKLITRASLKELEPALKLRKENWDSWKWTENKAEKLEKKLEDLKAVVEDINKALEGSGRAIGHRVWQSIENYIKNYPLVLANLENEDDNDLNRYLQVAFEDALVQKLIPKLRGLETSGDIRTKCLDKIKEIVEQKANGILTDFEIALNNPYGVFVWTSSTYLEKDI